MPGSRLRPSPIESGRIGARREDGRKGFAGAILRTMDRP
jgi:hypothetical protein